MKKEVERKKMKVRSMRKEEEAAQLNDLIHLFYNV